ncbi:MAG TPA: cytochrome c [Candidatus Acidoferrales bacterium]|nr:cytochrome c [Candidatus Acidoferrales bacterium]
MTRYGKLVPLGLLLSIAGCSVSPPSAFERAVAREVKQKVTVRGKHATNPLPASAENIQAGRQAFSRYCMVCHGLDGQNTGVPFADRMSPPVPLLTSPDVQSYTDGQLKWIIDNGIYPSGMPASKGILNDGEIWQIVNYIRHLPPQGSLGEPAVYSGREETPAPDRRRQTVR